MVAGLFLYKGTELYLDIAALVLTVVWAGLGWIAGIGVFYSFDLHSTSGTEEVVLLLSDAFSHPTSVHYLQICGVH